jgi:hypothetical protein
MINLRAVVFLEKKSEILHIKLSDSLEECKSLVSKTFCLAGSMMPFDLVFKNIQPQVFLQKVWDLRDMDALDIRFHSKDYENSDMDIEKGSMSEKDASLDEISMSSIQDDPEFALPRPRSQHM